MLQTRVGKRTGAAALKMAVDMTKGTGKGAGAGRSHARRRSCASPPSTSTRCCTRSSPARARARHRSRSLAGRGGRQGLLHRRRRRRRRRPRRAGDPRPQRDQPRGRARHDGGRGHPHRSRRPRQPRRRGRPRLGHPAIVGAEAVKISGKSFTVGDTVVNEGDVISIDGTFGEVVLGERWSWPAPSRPPSSTRSSWADKIRKGKLAVRANADTGEDAANARSSVPRASACAAPSTCSSPPTACRWCAR
jgi:pyruvate, orthophosphate dikinase